MTAPQPRPNAQTRLTLPAAGPWSLFGSSLAALAVLWLPLAVLQEVDALAAFTPATSLLRDVLLLWPLSALLAAGLAMLAWSAGQTARLWQGGAAQRDRIAWAVLLVPVLWLCAWQFTRSLRMWLQATSGIALSVGPHTRLVGISVLLALVLLLWWRYGAERLGTRAIGLLLALRAPAFLLVALGLAATLFNPPTLRIAAPPRPTPAADAGSTPDILLISIDALAAEDAAVCGSGPTPMPRLRAFAARANCFSRFYAASNFTTPTTSTMETGALPWTHFAAQIAAKVPPSLGGQTLAAQLRAAGWRTYQVGDNFLASPLQRGTWRGYDEVRFEPSLLRHRVRAALSVWPDTTLPLLTDTILSFIGALDVYLYGERNPYDAMHSYRHVGPLLSAAAGPAFLWVHTMPPHAPYLPPTSTRHRLLPPGELEKWHEFLEENVPYGPRAQPLVDKHRLRYRESIMAADDALGRLLDELQAAGRLERALVIVTADHGESFERHFIGHAGPLLHDAVVHVPLVVKLPGQVSGRVLEDPVSQADLAPTVLDLVGAAPLARAEGRSLRPQLLEQPQPAVPVFAMTLERQSRFEPLRAGRFAVIDGTHKLVWDAQGGGVELYDLSTDPRELADLAAERPALAARLQALLRTRLDAAERARTAADPR